MMKIIRTIIVFFCLFFSLNLYAADVNSKIHFQISGVDGQELENIKTRIGVDDNSDLSVANAQQAFADARTDIIKAIEPFGYFRPTVQSNLIRQKNNWLATYNVSLGPAIKIAKLTVSITGPGSADPKFKKYRNNFPLSVGDVFNADEYENAKQRMFQTANDHGYIKAVFNNKVIVDLKNYKVYMTIELQTNAQYYFGKISYNNVDYRPSFIDRFITIEPGQVYSTSKLISLQQRISSSTYFTNVVATPDFSNVSTDNHVPINLSMTLPKSQRYTVGVGYGTFTGPRVTAGMTLRRTTDTGQHLDAQIQYSPVLSSLGFKYYIPGSDPINDQWVLGTTAQYFAPQDPQTKKVNAQSQSITLTGGYTTKNGNWTNAYTLNYLLERYKVLKGEDYSLSKLLYPQLNISYSKADDLLNPQNGFAFTFNLQGASKTVVSTTNFAQGELSAKYLFSPMDFNKIIVRGDFGYTIVNDINKLPLTMRFNTGGVNSIRGYGDSSIGPGKYLEVGSVEYRNKIYKDLDAAVFYDVGTATDHFGEPLSSGAGVGLVYNSMIGPIKLYGAQRLDGSGHKGVYISIGPEF